MPRMISVIIPTNNHEEALADTLEALVAAAIDGVVTEVVVVDAGSTDQTVAIADAMGAQVIARETGGRGSQLAAGADAARGDWLLFLPPGTTPEPDWEIEAGAFMRGATRSGGRAAAAFRFALRDQSPAAQRAELFARLRFQLLALPLAAQGLLISRRFYRELGGYRPLAAMADEDLLRRIGPARIVALRAAALSGADWAQDGRDILRSLKKLVALVLFYCRVPTRLLARIAR
jgi:glycosyltransferase involved in cell wall biosynthesis